MPFAILWRESRLRGLGTKKITKTYFIVGPDLRQAIGRWRGALWRGLIRAEGVIDGVQAKLIDELMEERELIGGHGEGVRAELASD